MNKLAKKLIAGVATSAIFAFVFVPSVFATTPDGLVISGNGNNSDNTISTTETCITAVGQLNVTLAGTLAVADSSTGGNTANNNTGGDVKIDSGDATSTIKVNVTSGDNIATLPNCCCGPTTTPTQEISGNGNNTTNNITTDTTKIVVAGQANLTGALTGAFADSKTGKNTAIGNTGGKTTITSGAARSKIKVRVKGGSNTLNPTI